jgi:hypothetical protein
MRTSFLTLLLLCTLASPALAYVGPGPGMSMIGSFFTLIGGVFLALFLVLLYPIRLLLKRRKQGSSTEAPKE